MKLEELFEAEQKYEIERTVGKNPSQTHDGISLRRISDMQQFSHAEKQRIAKLAIGDELTLRSDSEYGKVVVNVKRVS